MNEKEERPCQTCKFKLDCIAFQKVGLPLLCDTEEHEHYQQEQKKGENND